MSPEMYNAVKQYIIIGILYIYKYTKTRLNPSDRAIRLYIIGIIYTCWPMGLNNEQISSSSLLFKHAKCIRLTAE